MFYFKQLYDEADVLKARIQLLNKTNMVRKLWRNVCRIAQELLEIFSYSIEV